MPGKARRTKPNASGTAAGPGDRGAEPEETLGPSLGCGPFEMGLPLLPPRRQSRAAMVAAAGSDGGACQPGRRRAGAAERLAPGQGLIEPRAAAGAARQPGPSPRQRLQ